MKRNSVEVLVAAIEAIDNLQALEAGTWDRLTPLRAALAAEVEHLVEARNASIERAKARSAEMRTQALSRLVAIADEFGVTPCTIGQHATRTGTYAARKKPRSDARLPDAYGQVGIELALRVHEACAPWSPHYLGEVWRRSGGSSA